MVSALLKKKPTTNEWYCSNCMMRQAHLRTQCFFCGSIFSNYEDALYQNYEELKKEEIKRLEANNYEIRRDE